MLIETIVRLLAAAVAIAAASPGAGAADLIKLSHANRNDPFDNATAAMATVFKSLVEAGSGRAIQVDIYPEGQLGGDAAVAALVRDGVIQSAVSPAAGVAGLYPLIGVLDVPFAFSSIASTYPVFDGPFGQRLAADFARKTGMHVLGFVDSGGFFAFTNSVRPIKTPADMAGLKIRTMGLPTHEVLVRSLGAEAVPMPYSELFTALQTHAVDGEMNPIPIIRFAHFDEVQRYLTLSNHLVTPYVWVLNGAFWNGLSPEARRVVDNAARSAVVAGRGISRVIEASDRGLASLMQRMEVSVPDAAALAAFREASQPAIQAHIAKTFGAEGSDLMNAFLAAIADSAQ